VTPLILMTFAKDAFVQAIDHKVIANLIGVSDPN
jgi:hypothetical protein